MTSDVSHEVQFPRTGSQVHRIALIDGPDMPNLGHRSKKVVEECPAPGAAKPRDGHSL